MQHEIGVITAARTAVGSGLTTVPAHPANDDRAAAPEPDSVHSELVGQCWPDEDSAA
jgi:hypothetical protein